MVLSAWYISEFMVTTVVDADAYLNLKQMAALQWYPRFVPAACKIDEFDELRDDKWSQGFVPGLAKAPRT